MTYLNYKKLLTVTALLGSMVVFAGVIYFANPLASHAKTPPVVYFNKDMGCGATVGADEDYWCGDPYGKQSSTYKHQTQTCAPDERGYQSQVVWCTYDDPFVDDTYRITGTCKPDPTCAAPPSVSLSANPSSVVQGNSSLLSWDGGTATSCTGTNFSTGGAVTGQLSVTPSATTNYSVSCSNAAGNGSANTSVTVTAAPHQPNTPTLSCNPTSVTTGQTATFTAQGTDSSENIQYWFDWGDNTFPPADYSTGYVPSGSARSTTHTYSTPGTYTVQAFSQNQTSGRYSGYATCTMTVTAPPTSAPDLTASTPTPSTATAGMPVTFSGTISNVGNATASYYGSVTNVFERATNSSGANEVDMGTANTAAIGPGSSATATLANYTFPSAGTYYVQLCADNNWYGGSGFISESNESNNCSGWTPVTVAASILPPHQPTTPSLSCNPTSVQTNQPVTFTAQGTDSSENIRYWFDWGDNTFPPADYSSPYVASGVAQSTTHSYTNPGSYLVQAFSQNQTSTLYSGYATCTVTVTATPPLPFVDLTAGSISPVSTIVGASNTFSVPIINNGTQSASSPQSGNGVINLFQIATVSSGLDAMDVSTYITPAIPGGGQAIATNNHVFNTAGTYYMRACADKDWAGGSGFIAEPYGGDSSDEGNNCGPWTAITVSNGASASLTASPTSIASGGSSTLTWTSTGETYCTGLGFNTGNATSGSVPVSPTVTTTYNLTCGPASAGANATVTVTAGGGGGGLGSCKASDTGNVTVTGATSGGTVWGSSPYTQDSNIGMAAVHAGLITPGQQAIIHKEAIGDVSSFTGTTAHGVTSTSYGAWCGINLSLVQILGGCAGSPTPTISASPTKVQNGGQTIVTWGGTNVSTSCVLQKNGVTLKTGTANSCTVSPQTTPDIVTTQSKYCVVCDSGTPACVTVTPTAKFLEF